MGVTQSTLHHLIHLPKKRIEKMRLYIRIIILLVIITMSLELTNAKKRNSGGSKPLKPSKPSGSTIKKLKKAALIGVGVYAGYKLTKAAAKFANFDDPDTDFDTWNRWREADGFLCRTDNHCNWLDENLECQQVGECGCKDGFVWDGDELECKFSLKLKIERNHFNNREPTKDSTVSESSEPTNESLCEDGKVWDTEKNECKLTTFRLAIQWIVLI